MAAMDNALVLVQTYRDIDAWLESLPMAAMDNALVLVRTYRDIDAWPARIRDAQGFVQTLGRSIMDLDEQIAIIMANVTPGSLGTGGFVSVAHEQAVMTRARLYDQLAIANLQLRELREIPSRETRLQEYLEACHSIDLAIKTRDLLPPSSEVMQHDEIERTLFPQHLVPATDFAADQMSIWHNLTWSSALRFKACYASFVDLEFIRAHVDGSIVSCAGSLFKFMQMTVDEAVNAILGEIVRERPLVRMLEVDSFLQTVHGRQETYLSRSPLYRGMSTLFAYQRGPGILRKTLPVLVTCYRPPNRLSLNEILCGLRGEIEPMRDMIQSPFAGNFDEMSRVLVVAVITQLYHHMLVVGTRFGYITTGEAYIFVEVSAEDPRVTSYAVCVPRYDVESDPETGLYRTAVAQVLAFTLRALRACRAERMSPLEYQEARQNLWRWRVNADDIFNKIPPPVRKAKRDIAYEPGIWRQSFPWTVLRRRDPRLLLPGFRPPFNQAGLNDFGCFRFFSTDRIDPAGLAIHQRPFCTPECLYGVERSRALDKSCPNFRYHGSGHLLLEDLLDGLQQQLDDDVANENYANYQFLSRCGPYTVLLKVRLASRGYTLLLKGVMPAKVDHLSREVDMYGQLVRLQAVRVPVCLGIIQTQREVRLHAFGDFTDFMVFGGFAEGIKPLFQCMAEGVDKQLIVDAVDETFRHIHGERVLHFDPEPRNMLYDATLNRVIIADFERAVYDVLEGQQWLHATVKNAGVPDWRLERTTIRDEAFGRERQYVRRRVMDFFERGY